MKNLLNFFFFLQNLNVILEPNQVFLSFERGWLGMWHTFSSLQVNVFLQYWGGNWKLEFNRILIVDLNTQGKRRTQSLQSLNTVYGIVTKR